MRYLLGVCCVCSQWMTNRQTSHGWDSFWCNMDSPYLWCDADLTLHSQHSPPPWRYSNVQICHLAMTLLQRILSLSWECFALIVWRGNREWWKWGHLNWIEMSLRSTVLIMKYWQLNPLFTQCQSLTNQCCDPQLGQLFAFCHVPLVSHPDTQVTLWHQAETDEGVTYQ